MINDQHAEWRRALAAKAKAARNQRSKRSLATMTHAGIVRVKPNVGPEPPGGSKERNHDMNPGQDDKAARRAELGTIVGIYNAPPDWFEGDWPEQPPRAMAVMKWPGRKKLTVEPLGNLIKVQL